MKQFGPEELLDCYRRGVFPMADNRDDPNVYLLDPDHRGIIPLDKLHVSKSLKKFIRNMSFSVTFDKAFPQVIEKCAEAAPGRENTWINDGIEFLYGRLHDMGNAHSVEVWQDNILVGGLYGVSIGGAFFGESMFSRATNASKIALVYLVERLLQGGYILLDTQFITDHLRTMGAIEISRMEYHALLTDALLVKASFHLAPN
ncbi:leucyl/phenylalanyl-tRNA--protein transferase [Hellea balneolensis]|uniref:leucyl/phenylalanyl-tRNA--protein transferase n=1 Tax=Hellea balneolensis TaxID=287478 RepID=UPI0004045BD2|nr:leucyl/phenylalanyl-tRNA--protein transferase [Hellea balneolensis]